MTRLILIRHGETDWNIEGRWQGQSDVLMNERGKAQVKAMTSQITDINIAAIYSSDLARARDTAEILGREIGMTVNIDPRLREIHQGKWEGMLASGIQTRYAREFQRRNKDPFSVSPPGGETALEVKERITDFMNETIRNHPKGTVAVVTHGFVIAISLVIYRKLPLQNIWNLIPGNATWTDLEITL